MDYTNLSITGLLCTAVITLAGVVRYLYSKNLEQVEVYIQIIKEQGEVLSDLRKFLEKHDG